MKDQLKDNEDIVMKLINSEFGEKYSLANKIEDIEELPIREFCVIQKLLSSGEAIMRMSPGSIDSTTFRIISTPSEDWRFLICSFVTYLGPIIGIILSFMYSWYWVFLVIIAPVMGMKLDKNVYLRTLFDRAFNSEIMFSFLFTAGKITIELPNHGILYRRPE